MKVGNILRHLSLVIRHKNKVMIHCFKCGLVWRGLAHDMSKFTPTEFFESAKYYQGSYSPIVACRRDKGMSQAWLHHKGRNRHHIEYWLDPECKEPPMMPYKFAVECICDKLAATKTYRGRDYKPEDALAHWERSGKKVEGNPRTMRFVEVVFRDLAEHGEGYILNKKYMKETYKRICLNGE